MPDAAVGVGIGAGLDALSNWYASYQDRKFRQQVFQAQQDREQRRAEMMQNLALVRAESAERVAGTRAASQRYAADQGYAGRTYAADTSADARGYAADTAAEARGKASENTLKGRTYAADQALAGRRYSADQSLAGANVRANATMGAARTGAAARRYAADTSAAGANVRSLRSLYGTMNHPRNMGTDVMGRPNPQPAAPSIGDWMKQQGMSPEDRAAATGEVPATQVKPEHQATAADYLQQIRAAQAKGDAKTVDALKKKAGEFLDSLKAAPAGKGSFAEGTDEEPEPDEDDDDDDDDNNEEP